ncbi:autophagy-related protein (macronuclear) [Tetrahymena thermophila SB210]|uniref:Autophagy-related protein n=1 Tax=Tetrahymena thermophila (strain SB210) TaxID=312017 RepID=Q231H2_TETTS|nr:autophagy-related protein [Tetrahymena thermophila SB210]EAR91067.2 autophagy-related protein [Tetrahymena thermophila SB210]|eukprot:XP_001011312.2 autophagy-related protein [Tetrahymena thermophila SB210]
MFRNILLLALAISIVSAQDEKYDLLANLSLGLDEKWEKIASIELNIKLGSGYIITDNLQLIPREVISQANNSTRYLQLKLVSQKYPEQPELLTTVDLVQSFPNKQFKEVVEINVDEDGNINSFSYLVKNIDEKKNKKKSVTTDDKDIDEDFKVYITKTTQSLSSHYQPPKTNTKQKPNQGNQQGQNQNQEQQQQQPEQEGGIMGFLKNNFWYIVIGLIVFQFMSGVADPNAAQGQGQGQAQRPAQR